MAKTTEITQAAWQEAKERFQQIWGYQDFRPPQGEIIKALLLGRDALIILPTGGGKSICFQLPALLQTGLTLVVSPLVALMENQVGGLKQLGLPGSLLHGEIAKSDRQKTLEAIARQQLSLLYLSPETLLSPPVWELIARSEIKITGLILDEAHCLDRWGTSFRPAYRRLGAVRRSLLRTKPPGTKIAIAAFTATADPQAQQEIVRVLELQQPVKFCLSPLRSNLHLNVKTVWTPRGRKQQMLKFIGDRGDRSGLVYVRSRQDSEALAEWFKSQNYKAAAYHAGLVNTTRRNLERDWISDKLQFVICTSAFGMGIDKPDVRWIVHYHAPESLAEYIQEVGRGGRDGKPAVALTLVSEPTGWLNPEDKQRGRFFQHRLERQYERAKQLAKQLPERGAIATIKERYPQSEIALGILHGLGSVSWEDPFNYRKISAKISLNTLQERSQRERVQIQQYLQTKQCRWQYLLRAFGFNEEATEFRCGCCDNCQKS